MSDESTWSQRKAWNNDGMDPDWRPEPVDFPSMMKQLRAENAKLRAALEDMKLHSVHPFTTEKWMNYINEVVREALGEDACNEPKEKP